ncbi:GFA family protein [Blastomonas sp. AAP53]|uniref:GFA family protein n=1 Tax=Blastomonas sp. AAP53 TaxID=1248760 RepID=UPI0003190D96|nr:GFA family protein [Blastomonas sp. AAP53]
MSAESITVAGGCHCGAVRFEAEVPRTVRLLSCNCSMCAKTGFLHLIVPHADLRLISGGESLTSYRFGTGRAEHLFCRICGIRSFYQPRSHPEAWSVDLRCLDEGHGLATEIEAFDGLNWESARAALADD